MGELHLQIYVERMKRAYSVDVETGLPQVNYRETIRQRSEFNYLHQKQTGGRFGSIRACVTLGRFQRACFPHSYGASYSPSVYEGQPWIVEPVMALEVEVPNEFQGTAIAEVNRRRGLINSSDADDMHAVIKCDVPLQNMFGFSTDLRSSTRGKGELTMEYKTHGIVMRDMQEKLMSEHEKAQAAKNK
ncbi:unnamed protein product [Hyaloperonospora brassicae]|uniref:Elongation factor EFG domain-containing protein n=1 Tax=Hyaloperonospora brassicae TaxID=162125 RepID=A0AAV0T1X5_HYABA|nr:unnamed protein product [Hyaloperonospora brassicae]